MAGLNISADITRNLYLARGYLCVQSRIDLVVTQTSRSFVQYDPTDPRYVLNVGIAIM